MRRGDAAALTAAAAGIDRPRSASPAAERSPVIEAGHEVNEAWIATLPLPDGGILAKLVWKHVPTAEVGEAFVPRQVTTLRRAKYKPV